VDKKNTSAREAALLILHQVEKNKAYANLQTAKVLDAGGYSPLDMRLITEISYGTQRMRAAIDYILGRLLTKPLDSLPLWILLILRISIYQLVYLDKLPPSAVVNEGVKLAKKYGHAGTASLVNAVLRNYLRKTEDGSLTLPTKGAGEEYLITTLSHPIWLIEYLQAFWSMEDIEAFCLFNNARPSVNIRTNTLKTTREDLMEKLITEGMDPTLGRYAPESIILGKLGGISHLASFKQGLFQVQDEASMIAAHVLGVSKGAKVLDLCAAPGGKTTHIAQLMADEGEIHAFDVHEHKIALIKENCRRLGIDSVQAGLCDARHLPASYQGWADFILLDAPCSGLGVLGRRPDARWRKSPEDIDLMGALSREILQAAADYLKPGGIICFSTCTIAPEENEMAIKEFLQTRTDFSLISFPDMPWLSQEETVLQKGTLQLLPQKHGMEGFFLARLQKKLDF